MTIQDVISVRTHTFCSESGEKKTPVIEKLRYYGYFKRLKPEIPVELFSNERLVEIVVAGDELEATGLYMFIFGRYCQKLEIDITEFLYVGKTDSEEGLSKRIEKYAAHSRHNPPLVKDNRFIHDFINDYYSAVKKRENMERIHIYCLEKNEYPPEFIGDDNLDLETTLILPFCNASLKKKESLDTAG